MTRQQVAQRLGKSVATVRRVEGELQFPVRDARGVYRFDRDDVEDLARNVDEGRLTLLGNRQEGLQGLTDLNARDDRPCVRCSDLETHITSLREQLRSQRAGHQRSLSTLAEERERERRALHAAESELLSEVDELVGLLGD